MTKPSDNFNKLFQTIDELRRNDYKESIKSELLFELLTIENKNYEKDSDDALREVIKLLENYFKDMGLE